MHDCMYEPLNYFVNVSQNKIIIVNNSLSFTAEGYYIIEAINGISSFHRIEIAREILKGTGYEIKEIK